jgi:aspartate racemase
MKLGILGGMGPLATAEFFKKIVNMTPVHADQDHLRVLMDDNPQIPDRTAFIMGEGPDPTREMIRSALKLEYMGADFIAMPCNTAHKFHGAIQKFLNIPLLNMVALTASYIKDNWPDKKRVVLLATKGTYTAGIYNFALHAKNLEIIVPDSDIQAELMHWIYQVKNDGTVPSKQAFEAVIKSMTSYEEVPVILGCTELPIIVDQLKPEGIYVDTTTVLAKACVELGLQKKETLKKSESIA